jgi:photosystem II stability/assembly factor-like uncharacterized protein
MYKSFLVFLLTYACLLNANTQTIEVLTTGTRTSLRGLSAVNDNIIWVSGSEGTVGRTVDGGKNWQWMVVPGFEKREFRDIEAFDANTAVAMAIAEPGQIVKTVDGGKNWQVVFTDTSKGVFFDAMDFADEDNGVVVGDPLPGTNTIYRAYTRNAGTKWQHPADDKNYLPTVKEGEAMFASSGTNVVFLKSEGFIRSNHMFIVTGGTASNLISQTPLQKKSLPIIQGKESTGANSIAAFNLRELVIVGGDFSNDKDSTQNCVISKDGGNSFIRPSTPPKGYRSCVEYITRNKLITCGTSGVDVSNDGGMNWQPLSTESYHVCQKSKKGKFVFLAGSNGRVAKLIW